jgi:hypothetical protein
MRNLVSLISVPRPPLQAFLPTFLLNGNPALCHTFCEELHRAPYSWELTDLILECLYEEPRQRPTLAELKSTIAAALAFFQEPGAQREAWPMFLDPRGSLPQPRQRPHILDARRHRRRRDSENEEAYIDDGRFEMGETVAPLNDARQRRRRRVR